MLWDVEDPTLPRLSAHRRQKGCLPTHRPRSTPHKHYFSNSGTHFC
jgi:hypothetical protein